MKVAWVSSMQLDPFGVVKGETEASVTHRMTLAAHEILLAAGVESRIFYDAGGDGRGLERLSRQVTLAIEWGPTDLLSVHVDSVGDAQRTGVLVCTGPGAEAWAAPLGRLIAEETGYQYDGLRNTYGGYAVVNRPSKRGIRAAIEEIGEYSRPDEARDLVAGAEILGRGIGRAWLRSRGLQTPAAAGDEEVEMTEEDRAMLAAVRKSTQVQSLRSAITNALAAGLPARAQTLNEEFYRLYPEGESGLPAGWAPAA